MMYHPAAPTAAEQAAGFTNEDDFEFLELYNRSGSPQTLNNFYVGDGVGFTFGWYPDGTGSEAWTLESGATATWSAAGLSSGSYTVYAHYSLVDGNGTRRSNLDQDAQYTITYAGGSTTVTVDQNQTNVVGNDVWVNLGVYSFNGPATVTLTRGDTDPNDWTIADTVKLTAAGHSDVIVGSPTLNSFSTGSGLTTLAPGGYVVLVSNYAAFDQRYHVAANHIPVAGVYSGHLSNGGEMVRLDQIGDTYPGYIASYEIDHVNYGDGGALAHRARRQRAGPDPHPHGRLRQRSDQLGGEQHRRHAGSGQPPDRHVGADHAHESRRPRDAQPHHDHADVDGFDRQPELRRSLRRLPQRFGDRHLDDGLL